MRKDDLNVHIDDLPKERVLNEKKYGGTGLISEKTEALYAELNERAEAATNRYSATDDFLQYNIFIRFI